MHRRRGRYGVALAVLAATVAANTAAAQSTQGEASAVQEVIVTAQKREQRAFDVPITLSVLGGDELRQKSISSFNDLLSQIPGTNFDSSNGFAHTQNVSIRGISAAESYVNGNPTAALHVDGIYQGSGLYVTGQIFDVERVEVLKGPQGTLYGRNATSGAVNIVSRGPGDRWEGFVKADIGSYERRKVEAGVGGPLSDKVGLRVAGFYEKGGGFVRNLGTYRFVGANALPGRLPPVAYTPAEDGFGDKDFLAGRLTLKAELTDQTSATLRLLGSRNRSDQSPIDNVGPGFDGNVPADADLKTVEYEARKRLNEDFAGANLEVAHSFSETIRVTSIVSYQHMKAADQGYYPFLFQGSERTFNGDLEQFTGEIRLNRDSADGKMHTVVGAFYLDDKVDHGFKTYYISRTSPLNDLSTYAQSKESFAFFGQNDWEFIPKTELSVGLRYTSEKARNQGSVINFAPALWGVPVNPQLPFFFDESLKDSNVSGRLALTYHWSDNAMVYGSISKGFRAGSFDGSGLRTRGDALPTEPETLWAYELGARYQNRWLNLSGAVFHYDYRNLQATTSIDDPFTGLPNTVLTNVGTAEINGAEASIAVYPTEGLTLSINGAYNKSKIRSYKNNARIVGNHLTYAPELTVNASIDYRHSISDDVTAFAGATYRFNDEIYVDLTNTYPRPSYSLVDLRAGVELPHRIEIGAYVKNVFDKDYATYYLPQARAGVFDGAYYRGVAGAPRTYGLSLSYSF